MIWPGADWSAWLCQDGFQDYKLPGDVKSFQDDSEYLRMFSVILICLGVLNMLIFDNEFISSEIHENSMPEIE